MTVGNYNITNPHVDQHLPDSHTVTVRVSSQKGDNIYHYNEHVQSGQFAFVTAEAGSYMACFWTASHKPQITLTIDFDWRIGIAAKDWSNVAKKSHIDEMVLELQILQEVVSSISEETIYLRKQ
ncbi:Transmembrane emp24 domain-containing protein p24delta10, partial [Mucuna pruriens]